MHKKIQPSILSVPVILIMSIVVCFAVPDFPAVIYGSLETSSGIPVTSEGVSLTFSGDQGGEVQFTPSVGSFGAGVTFVGRVPVESGPPSAGGKALASLGRYAVSVSFEGGEVLSSDFPGEISVTRALVIGPVTIVVDPENPTLSVTHDLNLGTVPVGGKREGVFTLYNVGKTGQVQGTVSLMEGEGFSLLSPADFDLGPGEQQEVRVRFAPDQEDTEFRAVFVADSNVGRQERYIRGNSIPGRQDQNEDGEINFMDLFILSRSWHLLEHDSKSDLDADGKNDEGDILTFLETKKAKEE